MAELITATDFEARVLHASKPVLVDFFATWCAPCKMMSPVIDELAQSNDSIEVVKLDIDDAMAIAETYQVMAVPTFIAFKNGTVSGKLTGIQRKEALLALFE